MIRNKCFKTLRRPIYIDNEYLEEKKDKMKEKEKMNIIVEKRKLYKDIETIIYTRNKYI